MKLDSEKHEIKGLCYCIRSAKETDAKELSRILLLIDGETENMDRESGEGCFDEEKFKELIKEDSKAENHIFLVVEVEGVLAGFSRCEGNTLKRMKHKAEFGVCVCKEFWGHQMGRKLLECTISWADKIGLEKIELSVLETNKKAISLYLELGFEVEGLIRKDKRLSDGSFYDTIAMGRLRQLT
ncbi:GNAT family N-acetyltransferase [Clostridium sp. E02]|uniref:GNAT family N-acetyltransferase n=1 Tax=Clostridium sp. E02 TaxID=2487134 RepID=UPI000F539ED9|nr:GNAT family N-acetyltransferase [Clostridium sp. E02]